MYALNVINLIKWFTTICSAIIILPIFYNHFGHKIVAVTLPTTLNQLVQLLTLKKKQLLTHVLIYMNKSDVNRGRYG